MRKSLCTFVAGCGAGVLVGWKLEAANQKKKEIDTQSLIHMIQLQAMHETQEELNKGTEFFTQQMGECMKTVKKIQDIRDENSKILELVQEKVDELLKLKG